jgi:hypothetical protein
MIICLVLALFTAVVYFLLAAGIISVPTLNSSDAPRVIVYFAGGCYALGGLLILAKKRGLLIFGLVMNTIVIAIFFTMYRHKSEVIFSFPGLATKIPQILLETGLIYLIYNYKKAVKEELRAIFHFPGSTR